MQGKEQEVKEKLCNTMMLVASILISFNRIENSFIIGSFFIFVLLYYVYLILGASQSKSRMFLIVTALTAVLFSIVLSTVVEKGASGAFTLLSLVAFSIMFFVLLIDKESIEHILQRSKTKPSALLKRKKYFPMVG